MKNLLGIIFFIILFFVWGKNNSAAQQKQKEVIYKFGEFLIDAKDTMNISFIAKSGFFNRKSGNQDVLYEDGKYLILGENDKLGYYEPFGGYRKYKVPHRFSNFKVKVYEGPLAPPDFKTKPAARLFRTQIKSQCKTKGVNFAGHFTIAHWGCGSNCEDIAIIDRLNGKIFYSNNLVGQHFDSFYQFKCRPDSKMIIMNSWLLGRPHKGYIFCSDIWALEIGVWNCSALNFLSKSPRKYDHNLQYN